MNSPEVALIVRPDQREAAVLVSSPEGIGVLGLETDGLVVVLHGPLFPAQVVAG